MRLLVTGAGGFVGAAVARAAASGGHDVFGTVRPGGNPSRAEQTGATVVPLDLHDKPQVAAALANIRPDILIHSAWGNVTAHRQANQGAATADIDAACTLVTAGVAAGLKRFVGIGSQAEYGLRDKPDNRAAVSEQHLPEPRSLYGAAKLAALALTRQLCAEGAISFAWLRLFATYGPSDNSAWLIPSLIDQILAGKVPRTSAGVQRCDYLYIEDAAEAVIAAAIRPDATGVFNLGSGSALRVRDIVEAIRDLVAPGHPIDFGAVPYGSNQVWHLQADISQLRQATGWAPATDFQTGLSRTVGWHRERRVHA